MDRIFFIAEKIQTAILLEQSWSNFWLFKIPSQIAWHGTWTVGIWANLPNQTNSSGQNETIIHVFFSKSILIEQSEVEFLTISISVHSDYNENSDYDVFTVPALVALVKLTLALTSLHLI